MKSRACNIFCAICFLSLMAGSSLATTVLNLNPDQMVKSADTIFVGTAGPSIISADATNIWTTNTFYVEEMIKGSSRPTIDVRQLGGAIDGITEEVSDIVPFTPGNRYLVFLETDKPDIMSPVIGVFQGRFQISNDILLNAAGNRVEWRGSASPLRQIARTSSGNVLTLPTMRQHIKAVLGGQPDAGDFAKALPSTPFSSTEPLRPEAVALSPDGYGPDFRILLSNGAPVRGWAGGLYQIYSGLSRQSATQDFPAALNAAIADWNTITPSIQVVLAGTAVSASAGDGRNTVIVSDSAGGSSWGAATLATTLSYFDGSNHTTQADVYVNPAFTFTSNGNPSAYDFQNVVGHELGHALGLDHPDLVTTNAIMQSTIPAGQTRRVLQSDRDGIVYIYGGFNLSVSPLQATIFQGGSADFQFSASLAGATPVCTNLPGSLSCTFTQLDPSHWVIHVTASPSAIGSLSFSVGAVRNGVVASAVNVALIVGTLITFESTTASIPAGGQGVFNFSVADPNATVSCVNPPGNLGCTFGSLSGANRVLTVDASPNTNGMIPLTVRASSGSSSSTVTLNVVVVPFVSVVPSARTVVPGSVSTFQVQVSPASISPTCGNLPGTLSCSFQMVSSGYWILTVTVSPNVTGQLSFTVDAVGSQSSSIPITIYVPDLRVSPAVRQVVAGTDTTFQILTSDINAVLTCPKESGQLGCTFSRIGDYSWTLNVTVTPNVTGQLTLPIQSASRLGTVQTSVTLNVVSLNVVQTTQSVLAGSTVTFQIQTSTPSMFTCTSLPAQLGPCQFQRSSDTTSTLTTTVTPNTTGELPFTIHAVNRLGQFDLPVDILVTSFTISSDLPEAVAGGTATYWIGMSDPNAQFSCPGLPAQILACSFQTVSPTSARLTITTASGASGPTTFRVQSVNRLGTFQSDATVTLQPFLVTPLTQTALLGSPGIYEITAPTVSGSPACTSAPAQISCSFQQISPQLWLLSVVSTRSTGEFDFNISINTGQATFSRQATLNVAIAKITPSSREIREGTASTFHVYLSDPATTLSCPDIPAVLTCSLSGSGLLRTLTVNATSQAAGLYTFNVEATNSATSTNIALTGDVFGPATASHADTVLDAAVFGNSLAPGEIVTVFGEGLASSTATATTLPLPLSLGNSTVFVDGVAAPLFYVSSGQINFSMPWSALAKSHVSILVSTPQGQTPPLTVSLNNVAPQIFTADGSGQGQGIIVNANSNQFAAPAGSLPGATPAARGSTITVYCTGIGPVDSPTADGAVTGSGPLARVLLPTVVMIDGIPVLPDFVGLAPTLAGVYQINVKIPQNATVGSTIDFSLISGGSISNVVTFAVQ